MMKRQHSGYTLGDRLEVSVERIVPGGAGLARGPHGAVLIELGAPGDRLDIEIDSLRGGVARGRIATIVDPSPARVMPPCSWYGACGGCDFQHLSYEAQLDAKEGILVDALERIGGIRLDTPVERFSAPNPFGSRSRVELHTDSTTGSVGFFERRTNQVVDIEQCLVSRPEIQQAITAIRSSNRARPPSIHLLAGPDVVCSAPPLPSVEGGAFWLALGGFEYLIHPAGFFQSSLDLLSPLIDRVVESAGPERRLAWDLYSGVGLFSLPLARVFDEVVGVEVDERATANAIRGAERNAVTNTRFVAADVSKWIDHRRQRSASPDLIVVDPPRTGLGPRLAATLCERPPARLTYVACDPAALARDLKILLSGSLRIADIAIFDLFPQTHHIETVVRLIDTHAASTS